MKPEVKAASASTLPILTPNTENSCSKETYAPTEMVEEELVPFSVPSCSSRWWRTRHSCRTGHHGRADRRSTERSQYRQNLRVGVGVIVLAGVGHVAGIVVRVGETERVRAVDIGFYRLRASNRLTVESLVVPGVRLLYVEFVSLFTVSYVPVNAQ